MTREEAIKWLQEEKFSLERAPDLNGCPMTEDWKKGIDVYDMAISALSAQQSKGVEIDQVKNAPLTLDELREMDGEPVWIFWPDRRIKSHWWIVGNYDWAMMEFDEPAQERDYGKTWLAYRCKPEEGAV